MTDAFMHYTSVHTHTFDQILSLKTQTQQIIKYKRLRREDFDACILGLCAKRYTWPAPLGHRHSDSQLGSVTLCLNADARCTCH